MEGWMIALIVIGAIVLLVLLFLGTTYNSLVSLRNKVKDQWSQIDVLLKRRTDLIPNLVETVKGYVSHEQDVLKKITELRNKNYSGLSDAEKMNLNSELGFGLAKLIAVAENYPDLKANQNFSNLMQELSLIEEDIANSRKYYNGNVREFNTFIQLFPTNIIAAVFGFKEEKLFEIDDKQRENVKVSF